MITTDNAIKWKKFMDIMGNTPEEAYKYWCDRVNADGSYWGIVKTDHPSKLGDVQQMSYQMINTLPCDKEGIFELARTSIDYTVLLLVLILTCILQADLIGLNSQISVHLLS